MRGQVLPICRKREEEREKKVPRDGPGKGPEKKGEIRFRQSPGVGKEKKKGGVGVGSRN